MTGEHPNAALVGRLYAGLDGRDGETMASLYAADAHFRDPAFGDLHADEVGAMWRMLTSQARDLAVTVSGVEADEAHGSAHWVASYTFRATGRPVENRVAATFAFRDGLIADHRDDFSIWRWSRQALGAPAWLLGSNPLGHALLQRQARRRLRSWQAGAGGA